MNNELNEKLKKAEENYRESEKKHKESEDRYKESEDRYRKSDKRNRELDLKLDQKIEDNQKLFKRNKIFEKENLESKKKSKVAEEKMEALVNEIKHFKTFLTDAIESKIAAMIQIVSKDKPQG